MKWILKALIYLYRFFISPVLGNCCRFSPTCSEYALISIEKHGALKGSWLTLKRLLKCNALFEGKSED